MVTYTTSQYIWSYHVLLNNGHVYIYKAYTCAAYTLQSFLCWWADFVTSGHSQGSCVCAQPTASYLLHRHESGTTFQTLGKKGTTCISQTLNYS